MRADSGKNLKSRRRATSFRHGPAATLAIRCLRRRFDGPELEALPESLRALAPWIAEAVNDAAGGDAEPDW